MNAPKKIWLSTCMEWEDVVQQSQSDIPYIRADIVDELVEALKEIVGDAEGYVTRTNKDVSWLINARAALSKMEESHE